MQSLCNNNVLGIVVNGARRGELYSKYTYYHSYYTPKDEEEKKPVDVAQTPRNGTHVPETLGEQAAAAPIAVAEAEATRPEPPAAG
jgi:hypothetical protein